MSPTPNTTLPLTRLAREWLEYTAASSGVPMSILVTEAVGAYLTSGIREPRDRRLEYRVPSNLLEELRTAARAVGREGQEASIICEAIEDAARSAWDD